MNIRNSDLFNWFL